MTINTVIESQLRLNRRTGSNASKEQVILVDAADRPIGRADKLAAHRKNLRHRAISVIIFDRDGRMLLQRRSASKYPSADLWSTACGSHVFTGFHDGDVAPDPDEVQISSGAASKPSGTISG